MTSLGTWLWSPSKSNNPEHGTSMQPLTRVYINPESLKVTDYIKAFDVSTEEAYRMIGVVLSEEVYVNDTYQVSVTRGHQTGREGWPSMAHISVMRLDKQPSRSWSDMQAIKNQLMGESNEGIEIYPAEDRLTDCAPQYHVWCFEDDTFRIPMGWTTRKVKPS